MENFINGLEAHKSALTAITVATNYSSAQKAKAKFFLNKLTNQKFVTIVLYSIDICRALSVLSKVCKKYNVTSCQLTE